MVLSMTPALSLASGPPHSEQLLLASSIITPYLISITNGGVRAADKRS